MVEVRARAWCLLGVWTWGGNDAIATDFERL
jgi:hypothetical protein